MSELKVNKVTPRSGTTVTLGDSGDTIALGSGVTASGIATTNGITEADQWRLSVDLTADADPITANLERVDEASFAKIGTGVSVSSGIWTFPSTGLYLIMWSGQITAVSDLLSFILKVTLDNSTYTGYGNAINQISSGTTRCNVSQSAFVNVTDTSNVKVAFAVSGNDGSSILHGNSTASETSFTFIRLGDSQ